MPINSFVELRDIYRVIAREAFLALRRGSPGERIYSFVLCTDDDAVAARPDGNTVEALSKKIAENPETSSTLRRLSEWGYRWTPDEWPGIYSEEMRAPEILSVPNDMHSEIMAFMERWKSTSGKGFKQFRANVFRAMVDALRQLDEEGLFGRSQDREAITLYITITDSDDEGFIDLESAAMLNSRRGARQRFEPMPIHYRWAFWLIYCWRWLRRGPIIAQAPIT